MPSNNRLSLSGRWVTQNHAARKQELSHIVRPSGASVVLDLGGIEALDSSGAYLLAGFLKELEAAGITPEVSGLQAKHEALIGFVRARCDELEPPEETTAPNLLVRVGSATESYVRASWRALAFFGEASMALMGALVRPQDIRWRAMAMQIQLVGLDALPIVGLLAFLIGIVISYQGGVQLRSYGAGIFVVELVALSAVRELGPLLAAIVVAGRTGASYAAQLASMQATDEIDAIRVMGLSPLKILVVPRILALMIALPLLSVFSIAAVVAGGMTMAIVLLDVSASDFVARLPGAVSAQALILGLVKTPVFALILSLVGCFQGLNAEKNAQSVGRNTTRSVVHGIFLVIIADAVFSIFYSILGV